MSLGQRGVYGWMSIESWCVTCRLCTRNTTAVGTTTEDTHVRQIREGAWGVPHHWSIILCSKEPFGALSCSSHSAECFSASWWALCMLQSPSSPARVAVYFSPNGGATEAVVRELNTAQTQVLMQAYSFTSAPIAKALVEAHKRGVKILAVLDKSNETEKYSAATFLANAGIQTLIDDQHAIAHNKVMVLDSATILTGSFNFTQQAEKRNAENL